ncbi:hypothetical protein GCM10018965_078860 [Nonomuraea roseola]
MADALRVGADGRRAFEGAPAEAIHLAQRGAAVRAGHGQHAGQSRVPIPGEAHGCHVGRAVWAHGGQRRDAGLARIRAAGANRTG